MWIVRFASVLFKETKRYLFVKGNGQIHVRLNNTRTKRVRQDIILLEFVGDRSSMKNVCGLAEHIGFILIIFFRAFSETWIIPSEASWSLAETVDEARHDDNASRVFWCGGLTETWKDQVGKEEVA